MRTTTHSSAQKIAQVDLPRFKGQLNATAESRTVLQSWKEIASALDRGVRTVQRWERTLQLPVYRLGQGRCPVFAFRDEVHRWWQTRANGDTRRSEVCKAQEFISGRGHSQESTLLSTSRQGILEEANSKARILESVKAFFESQSSGGQKKCERCKSVMQFLDGKVWLHGSGMEWKISLPFCPVCDIGMLDCLHTLQSIH
jgi:hypothetical protein